MAQHDYDIANAPGATVRADINNVLDAIVSLNSGAAAPTTTFPYMIWLDTTNNVIKQRNAANSAWITLGPIDDVQAWVGGGLLGRSYLAGLELANNATDADHDIDIAAGAARSDDDTVDMILSSTLVKQIDAAWVVGTNQGGLDTGTVAADTWYYLWLIKRTDTNVVDALFSTDSAAPTMPTNYNKKRRIGAVLTDSVANIIAFTQIGDEFLWKDPPLDIDVTNPGTAAVLRSLSVPSLSGGQVWAYMNLAVSDTAATNVWYFSSPDVNDEAPVFNVAPLFTLGNQVTAESAGTPAWIRTNASGQIRSRASGSGANTTLRIATLGWMDRRGRDD